VGLAVTNFANILTPALEWHCRQNAFCTHSVPSIKAVSAFAQFTDFTQYRGNVGSLGAWNEIVLQDGTGLYGSACTLDDCEAILYRNPDGRNKAAYCPIGSEMVLSVLGAVGAIDYIVNPAPRVQLNGELPASCVFVNGAYRCESGQVTLRFSSVEAVCDSSDRVECPFPLTGRHYGTCPADAQCGVELN
jgi:hypothetical protein